MDFSRRRNTRSEDKTPLQMLHDQASELLTQKNEQISKLNQELETAEKKLSDLKYKLKQQQEASKAAQDKEEDINEDEIPPEELKEIEDLKASHESEIQGLIERNEDETNQLEESYRNQLKEAEDWAQQHAEQILIEKQNEHKGLLEELQNLKAKLRDTEFTTTKTKFDLLEESKTTSMSNSEKIRYLENQLDELNSLMRDEMRSIKGKIDETYATYDTRLKEHQIEVEKYQAEIKMRSEKYDTHIDALQQQYDSEKAKYESAIRSSEHNYTRLQKVMKQLERQREKQVSSAIKDNEKMRTTIYSIRTKDDPNLEFTRTAITHLHMQDQQIAQMESDLKATEEEIQELVTENKDLQMQISKYNRLQEAKNGMKY